MTLKIFCKHVFLFFHHKCTDLFLIFFSFPIISTTAVIRHHPKVPPPTTSSRIRAVHASPVFAYLFYRNFRKSVALGDFDSSASSPLAGLVLTSQVSAAPYPQSSRHQRIMWPKIWRRCALWPSCAEQRCWRTCGQGPC